MSGGPGRSHRFAGRRRVRARHESPRLALRQRTAAPPTRTLEFEHDLLERLPCLAGGPRTLLWSLVQQAADPVRDAAVKRRRDGCGRWRVVVALAQEDGHRLV